MSWSSSRIYESPQALCRFGVARCDVTPPVGIYHRMWGAARHDRSTGVHRPLTATALVFAPSGAGESPDDDQVVVALDHCLLWGREMTALLQTVAERNSLRTEQVVVQFSHTHAAGLMGLERADQPGGDLIAGYLEEIGTRVAEAVSEARRSMRPATLVCGAGRCSLARNRDFHDAQSGQWVCGFNPEGRADDTVLVARVVEADGRTAAVLVNYACHPTTLAWDNTLISPDYPGALRETVERVVGAPCVFLQGASGDVGPLEGYVGDSAVADRNGRQLGYAVLEALESLPLPQTRFEYVGPVLSGATIGVWEHRPLDDDRLSRLAAFRIERFTVDLPLRTDQPSPTEVEADRERWQATEREALASGDPARAADCRAMVERCTRRLTRFRDLPAGETFPMPVMLMQTGDLLWVAVEGEPYQWLQTRLRERFPRMPLFVLVLANGSRCWYLPPANVYGSGRYQDTASVLAPGCLETLTDAIIVRIEALRS